MTCESIADTPNMTKLCFKVTDTGIGIDAVGVTKLFQAFSQVDPSINRRFGGAGLGLIISKKIIVRMSGDITVDSIPEKGTTFTVWLPVPIATEDDLFELTNTPVATLGRSKRYSIDHQSIASGDSEGDSSALPDIPSIGSYNKELFRILLIEDNRLVSTEREEILT